jgi:hypothetical protein
MRALLLVLLLAAVNLSASPAHAVQKEDGAQKKVTLDFKDVPLRAAVEKLFAGSDLQYAIEPTVPNVPITLQVRDTPLIDALRRLIRTAAPRVPGLTYAVEDNIYIIRVRRR